MVRLAERVKLEFPEDKVLFKTCIPATINMINYGKHMDNAAYLQVCHEARLRFLKHIGVSEENLGDGSTGLIMVEAIVQYMAEVTWGGQLLISIAPIVNPPFQLFFYYCFLVFVLFF